VTYTKSIPEVTQHIVDLLTAQKDALGLIDVFYGDQDKVPKFPSVGVESMPKRRTQLDTRKFRVDLSCGVYLYHGMLQATYKTKKEADTLSELIENALHTDFTFGGLVVFGYVTRVEPGIALKSEIMVKTTRLTWEGQSREVF
jgi:hypothetical protein